MANILCIYSATELCSVAVSQDSVTTVKRNSEVARSHTERITLLIQECMDHVGLDYADLDAVAVSAGPGSYTSLRIGASTAKGIAYAADCALLAISTLDIIAAATSPHVSEGVIVSMLDARRMEAYCATYDATGRRLTKDEPTIIDVTFMSDQTGAVILCGNGAAKAVAVLDESLDYIVDDTVADAGNMATLASKALACGQVVDIALWQPDYIKPVNIIKRKKPLL